MTNEIKKCKKDAIYFIENYVVVNDEPMLLHDYQKAFIHWLLKLKKYGKKLGHT